MPLPDPGSRVELVCLKGGLDIIRSRVRPHGETIIVRTGMSKIWPVPGEIFTVEVERSWLFGHRSYVKGLVVDTRIDVPRLELSPLGLTSHGPWVPEQEAWLFEQELSPLYEEIVAAGARTQYEMEEVLPADAVELRWEEDPILEAVALAESGATPEAEDLLGDLLSADLRCLAAHAHLGYVELRSRWPGGADRAERHFRAGVALGETALPQPVLDFTDLLPWGLLDNRPFLRCLHGLGLSRWRRGDLATARRIFHRLVWLAPDDGLGARFTLEDVAAGRSWESQ